MQETGRCSLCGEERVLQLSHVRLPKFVFKRLRADDARNPNPVQISTQGLVQTSAQDTQRLLCSDCEMLFARKGEDWVARMCLRDNNRNFPLLSLLSQSRHHVVMNDAAAFYSHDNPDINHEALQYFAASMFWRGQYLVLGGRRNYSLHRYDRQFRDYLLGRSPQFPSAASLFIWIRYRSNLTQVSHGVQAFSGATSTGLSFSIPGLTFQCEVGEFRDFKLRLSSFNENSLRPILDADAVDETHHNLLTKVRDKAQRRGRRWSLAGQKKRNN